MIIKKMTTEDFESIKSALLTQYDDFWTANVLKNNMDN